MIVGFFLVETNLINKIRNLETIAWTTTLFGGISGIIHGFAGLGSAILAIYIMAAPGTASIQRSKIIIASGVKIRKKTVPRTMGLTILPNRIPKLIHNLLKG